MSLSSDPEFPCSLTISTPFPTARLASTALNAISVDAELSPLVRRTLSISPEADGRVLRTEYRATTNRMLRVAVNGYMESLGVVMEIMGELDGDVLEGPIRMQKEEMGTQVDGS